MTLSEHLLELAYKEATMEPKRPRHATLRRSISTAYYALFHLLIQDGVRQLVSAKSQNSRYILTRTFEHRTMKAVCVEVSKPFGQMKNKYRMFFHNGVSPELQTIAETFEMLQKERHLADYDVRYKPNRKTTLSIYFYTLNAFSAWKKIRGTEEASTFVSLLISGEPR